MKRVPKCLLIVFLASLPLQSGWAAGLLGLYVGVAAGEAQLRAADNLDGDLGAFNKADAGFKAIAGIRPLPFLGAEVSYDELGRAIGHYYYNSPYYVNDEARLSMRGETAYGVLYLPIRHLDLFAKAGMAFIRSESSETGSFGPQCNPGQPCVNWISGISSTIDRTNTDFAAGAGAQITLGSWAIRGEYERFTAARAHPSLITVGVTWTL